LLSHPHDMDTADIKKLAELRLQARLQEVCATAIRNIRYSVDSSSFPMFVAPAASAPAPAPAAKKQAKKDDDDDDDMDDLFGDDDDEEEYDAGAAAEARKKKAAELAAAKKAAAERLAKKEKKQRSLCNLEIKPWEASQDLNALHKKIKETVVRDGLKWSENCALHEIAFGIKKMVLTAVIGMELSMDAIIEEMTEDLFPDEIQSMTMTSMSLL